MTVDLVKAHLECKLQVHAHSVFLPTGGQGQEYTMGIWEKKCAKICLQNSQDICYSSIIMILNTSEANLITLRLMGAV